MVAKLTKKEFEKWLDQSIGKQYNTDNHYGAQCFDSANAGWIELFGHPLKGQGAADIPTANNFDGEAVVYANTEKFLAKKGDLVVFNRSFGGGYGHVAWVLDATLDYIIVAEQNWEGKGWTDGVVSPGWGPEKVTKRKHSYSFPMWFIRPKFKSENTSKNTSKTTTKKPAKKSVKKAKKLNYIREEVTGYRLPNRGYKPRGIV